MRLPKFVNIGIYRYKLSKVKNLNRDDKNLYGYVDHQGLTIEVEKRVSNVVQLITVLHESMHGMVHQSGCHDVDAVVEERLIQLFSHGIVELFRYNPQLLKELNNLFEE